MSSPKSNKKSNQKQKWDTYRAAFGAPPSGHISTRMSSLRSVSLPKEVIERCPDLEQEWQNLQKDIIRVFSCPETSENEPKVKEFVDNIQDISEKQGKILKRARTISATWIDIQSPKRQRLAEEMIETEAAVLKYRTILASGKKNLVGDILSQTPSSLISDAFLDHFIEKNRTLWPVGAQISHENFSAMLGSSARPSRRQAKFRNLLKAAYSTPGKADQRGPLTWDPVIGAWLLDGDTRAAHIVPLCIGEYDYARLLGEDWVTEDTVFDLIWSTPNGLLLHHRLEKYLDDGVVVIVPTPNETGEYKLVVLYEDRKNDAIGTIQYRDERKDVFLRDLDGKQLEWLNDKRPSATNLYIRYLLTRVFRRKSLALGWEKDVEKVPSGQAWAEVRPLRRRMLGVLCEEIGDFVSDDVPGTKSVLDEAVNIAAIPETEGEASNSRTIAMGMAERVALDWMDKVGLGDE